jgi:pantoate--beta-alanine ligase
MKVVHKISDVRSQVRKARQNGKRIGLVPTMGSLHPGHLSLITAARESTDKNADGGFVAVSIFLNPTQFAPEEDLDGYPKTLENDLKLCEANGVDLVFAPGVEEMYPHKIVAEPTINLRGLSDRLCGKSRPTHFPGVCTVVAKLFGIVSPDEAFFGAKDFQQVVIIQQMVDGLNIPVDIIVCPIVRESDGLAMSSRNALLSPTDRQQAPALHAGIQLGAQMIVDSHPLATEVIDTIRKYICDNAPNGQIDYVQIVDPKSLQDVNTTGGAVLIALAVKFEGARLIDNTLVGA